ncbi:SDR family NAD(P)-dependent oxidoreductase [Bacillus amyloliquefaciens]|uniref:SDR family NAD(P)-dependent oxidoreductase n=1 Tax=Bacillus amyloliquefaciens TaxID=1390 RepID=UPI00255C0CE3|nr:SDR family NAD(P)-dependent oxidoreductase [Bacillus amyloliquefaciens]WIX29281.1 SDR family NAD(P)-dependent oxidoreductase [Bacillus amyloliquefaciens]
MFDLTGMTALVTGASGGIGSAIATALAGQGARLAVSGSNADKLEAFRAGLGGDHVAVPCDLSDAANEKNILQELLLKHVLCHYMTFQIPKKQEEHLELLIPCH